MLSIPEHKENTNAKTVTRETKEDCLLFVIESLFKLRDNFFRLFFLHSERTIAYANSRASLMPYQGEREISGFLEYSGQLGRGVEQLNHFQEVRLKGSVNQCGLGTQHSPSFRHD
jgi:hypothetical protein